eukprot:5737294-Pyramimonas_sp.AAC.1
MRRAILGAAGPTPSCAGPPHCDGVASIARTASRYTPQMPTSPAMTRKTLAPRKLLLVRTTMVPILANAGPSALEKRSSSPFTVW